MTHNPHPAGLIIFGFRKNRTTPEAAAFTSRHAAARNAALSHGLTSLLVEDDETISLAAGLREGKVGPMGGLTLFPVEPDVLASLEAARARRETAEKAADRPTLQKMAEEPADASEAPRATAEAAGAYEAGETTAEQLPAASDGGLPGAESASLRDPDAGYVNGIDHATRHESDATDAGLQSEPVDKSDQHITAHSSALEPNHQGAVPGDLADIWDLLKPGATVIAADLDKKGRPDGWYEASITSVDGELFELEWHDYAHEGTIVRRRKHLALVWPGPADRL